MKGMFDTIAVLSLLLCVGTGGLWAWSAIGQPGRYEAGSWRLGLGIQPVPQGLKITVVRDAGCVGQARADGGLQDSQPFSAFSVPHLVQARVAGFGIGRTRGGMVTWWFAQVPYWSLLVGSALPPALWVGSRRRQRRLARRAAGLCVKCGYDLRASRDRCPECGTAVPPHGPGRGEWRPY